MKIEHIRARKRFKRLVEERVAKSTRLVISIFLLPPETLALQGGEEVSFSNPTFFSFSAILLISASSALFPKP
jgi:hypothetical protein